MENKKNSNTNSSNNSNNSSPFPKLKPKGSIYISQIPLDSKNTNQISQKGKDSEKSNNEEKVDFFSRLKIFEPNAKKSNNNSLKHCKTLGPSFSENEDNDKDGLKKLTKKHSSCEINGPSIDDKKEIKEDNTFSVRNSLISAKKLFQNFGDYINDNIINKINFNFNFTKTDNNVENSLGINFEKPKNFGEIEKYWNYVKLLLDYNILDFGSKSIKLNYQILFYFFSYL